MKLDKSAMPSRIANFLLIPLIVENLLTNTTFFKFSFSSSSVFLFSGVVPLSLRGF